MKLLNSYLNLKIGKHTISTPYYQNLRREKKAPVYVGKGCPDEIVATTMEIFDFKQTDPNHYDKDQLRLYMVMRGIGIDCSGFVARILDTHLNEVFNIRLSEATLILFKKDHKDNFIKSPFTKLSAKMLTSVEICNTVKVRDIQPADLIKTGDSHVAIVTEVKKSDDQNIEITYAHSTSLYCEEHGVRKGTIHIGKNKKSLAKCKWDEDIRGINYSFNDYLNTPQNERGVFRIKVPSHNKR